jgi:glycosyltransferase involved in cell wall biosynthesis
MKPKIAYFLLRHPGERDQITGGTWSNLAVLGALESVEVLVITNQSDVLASELERLGIRHLVLPGELSYDGVRRDPWKLVRALGRALVYNGRFFAAVRREGVRVVQCDENAATFVCLGAKLARCGLVVAYRNYPGVVPTMRAFYKIPTLIADRLVATAEVLREAIVTQGWRSPAQRTECIYNGIDLDLVDKERASVDRAAVRSKLGIAENEVAMAVIGSIVPIKKQAEFIEEVVSAIGPELEARNGRIYLIGGTKDEAYAARCEEAIRSRGLERVVRTVGYVRDMTPWYAALDVSVYPGIEGVARTLIESQAYELPIVALAGCGEAVADGASGYLCDSLAEMGAPLLKLAASAALRREMGGHGRAFAEERFSVRKNRERYDALYTALAQER